MRRRSTRKKRSFSRLGSLSGTRSSSLVALGAAPPRRGSGWVVLVLGALVLVNLYVFVWDTKTSVGAIQRKAEEAPPAAALPTIPLSPVAPVAPSTPAPVGPPGT